MSILIYRITNYRFLKSLTPSKDIIDEAVNFFLNYYSLEILLHVL